MRSIDLFSGVASEALADADTLRLATVLLRGGTRSLARANPVAVWVEAGIAVGEALGDYCRYACQAELGRQLQIERERLDAVLGNVLAQGAMDLEQVRGCVRLKTLRVDLKWQRQHAELRLASDKVLEMLRLLRDMQALLRRERGRSGTLGQIVGLQVAVDQCIDVTLQLFLNQGERQ